MASSSPTPPAGAVDWGAGRYEHTAVQLAPVAQLVVERAGVRAGERVVDVGCGTGNAALAAGARGARVLGVDPTPRLLEVARARAAEGGVAADFAAGDAARLPVADGEADLVLSVFAVIFAPDPRAAARELARVTAPEGRVVLTAWIPEGGIAESNRAAREAIRAATGAPVGPAPFAWHDPEALAGLLEPVGLGRIEVVEERLPFTAPSLEAYVDAELEHHPFAVAGRAVLESRGQLAAVRERMCAILAAANEDPGAFRVTSRYVVVTARR